MHVKQYKNVAVAKKADYTTQCLFTSLCRQRKSFLFTHCTTGGAMCHVRFQLN